VEISVNLRLVGLACVSVACPERLSEARRSHSDFLPNQIYATLPCRQRFILFRRIMQIKQSLSEECPQSSRWHDPGGIQGDGKHSHLERSH